MSADDKASVLQSMTMLAVTGHSEAISVLESYNRKAITSADFVAFSKLIIAEQSEIQVRAVAKAPPRTVPKPPLYQRVIERGEDVPKVPINQRTPPDQSPAAGSSAGYLFMCSGKTYDECLRRALFGAAANKIATMRRAIVPRVTPLFLLHFGKRTLYGPFYASDAPASMIEPQAWVGAGQHPRGRSEPPDSSDESRSPYAAQVRVCREVDARCGGPVRVWTLPPDIFQSLTAGELDETQTASLLRELSCKGTIAREADQVPVLAKPQTQQLERQQQPQQQPPTTTTPTPPTPTPTPQQQQAQAQAMLAVNRGQPACPVVPSTARPVVPSGSSGSSGRSSGSSGGGSSGSGSGSGSSSGSGSGSGSGGGGGSSSGSGGGSGPSSSAVAASVPSLGFLFMCSSQTYDECMRRALFFASTGGQLMAC